MIKISDLDEADRKIFVFLIIGIALTSLVWVGDLASWAWIGNGFGLDIVLAFVAIIFTVITVFIYRRYREVNPKKNSSIEKATSSLQTSSISCPNCGEHFLKDSSSCSSCDTPMPVCVVCFSSFETEDTIVKLDCCSNYAHKDHLANFVAIKKQCPKCQKEIKNIEDMESFIL